MYMVANPSTEPQFKRRKIEKETNSSSYNRCNHFFVSYGICCNCKSNVGPKEGQAFDYLVDGLQLSNIAVAFTKKLTTHVTCLYDKKLHLVLDLDHTLLHTVTVSDLTQGEKYLIGEVDSRDDLWMFNLGYSSVFLMKLRPYVREFLKEANKMFSMYVYTMGDRDYAKAVLKIIDPERVYFGDRVITREESPCVKTLDLVLVDESGVVIVDDTPQVWPDHKRNLLEISKYNFFRDEIRYLKSYAEEKRDESYEDGSLRNVLSVLTEVYDGFFCGGIEKVSKDVRPLLRDCCRQSIW